MNYIPLSHVFLFSSLGGVAVVGGAALTAKLVGEDAGTRFMLLGGGIIIVAFLGLILLRRRSRRSAVAHLLFMPLAMNVGFTSILLAISLPLLLQYGIFSSIGLALVGYFLIILFYQLWRSCRNFSERWELRHKAILESCFKPALGVIDVKGLIPQLGIESDLLLPKRLERQRAFISLGLVISMVIGLNLRHVFPGFSAFAWGVPALTGVALFVQLSCPPVLLAMKLGEIERRSGTTIAPMVDDMVLRRRGKRKTKS